MAQASARELQSPTGSLGRLVSPTWDHRSGSTQVAAQSCFSSEKPPARYHGCYKFPPEKGTMAWNEQNMGVRVEKRRQLLTSLTSLTISLTSHGYFDSWLTTWSQSRCCLPLPTIYLQTEYTSLFSRQIYFIIFSSCAQGPPSAQLFVSASAPAVTFSASHQHTLSIPFETIYKVVKEHKFTFFPQNILEIWLLRSILKLDSYKEALKRSNSVNIQFLTTLYSAVLTLFLCSFCQAILTNEFADIIYRIVNLMCKNIKFILMSRNPSLICMFSQNKNKYLRLWIPNS